MAGYRKARINDETVKALSVIIREVKDPRVSGAFVSITGAEVTPDLKFAKVYFSAMGAGKDVKRGLESAVGFIRKRLAETLNLRITPEIKFYEDTSMEYGANISRLLNQIEPELRAAEAAEAAERAALEAQAEEEE
ncbi:MAG: 30S ribosome-binding factor RbfA [Clostridia bacterium]|nr:30S ribosome-binding factor RbfA [Clostridia bacterium]